jgi:hypothetical protein
VLATAATTETSTVTANPNGTLSSVIGAGPMQEPDPDSPTGWAPIDLSLSHDDGAYAPAVSGAEVSFSDGGTGALATLDTGEVSYVEDWSGSLPVPSVADDTLTYSNVYPDIDLVMQAQTTGFMQSWVLHQAPSKQLVLDVPLSLRGLSATVDEDGNLIVTDGDGNVVASAGTAVIYGAEMDASGEPVISATVDTAVVNEEHGPVFEITPDQSFFTTPGLQFPVVIDPSPNLSVTTDTYVRSSTPDSGYMTDNVLKVGTNGSSDKMRTLLKFPTLDSSVTGVPNPVRVDSATLKLYQIEANTCTATEVDVYDATSNWITATAPTWNNQPSAGSLWAKVSDARGKSGCSSNWISITSGGASGHAMKDLLQAWADGTTPNYGVIVKAASETDTSYWKKFRSTEQGSNTPYIAVTYTILPAITLSVTSGPPTTSVTVSGTYFTPNNTVHIDYSDPATSLVTGVATSFSGGFSTTITVPASAPPGEQTIQATDGASPALTASAPFVNITDWRQFHFTPDHQGVNPYEQWLRGGNVAVLQTAASYNTGKDHDLGTIETSPIVVGDTLYVGNSQGKLLAFDVNDLTANPWSVSLTPDVAIKSSPAAWHNLVIVGGQDDKVHAVNTNTHTEEWVANVDGPVVGPVTVADGYVYVGTVQTTPSSSGSMYKIAVSDGSVLKTFDQDAGGIVGGAAVYGSSVYFGTDNTDGQSGSVFSLAISGDWSDDPVWMADADGPIDTTPTVGELTGETDVTVYVTTGLNAVDGHPYVDAFIDDGLGTPRWSYKLGHVSNQGLVSSPALDLDAKVEGQSGVPLLLFGTPAGAVCALHAGGSEADPVWSYELPGGNFAVDSSPIVASDRAATADPFHNMVFVGADDGRMYGIRERNGVPIWNSAVQEDKQDMKGSAVVADGALYFVVLVGNDDQGNPTHSKIYKYVSAADRGHSAIDALDDPNDPTGPNQGPDCGGNGGE